MSRAYTRASEIKPKTVRFIYERHVPEGKLVLVAGVPGVGKSLVTSEIAAFLSRSGNVIFDNMEDELDDTIVPRLMVAGADLNNIIFEHFVLPDNLKQLREAITDLKARAVVLDPIAAHLSVNMFNDQKVRIALTPLKELAAQTKCSIIMVGHIVKAIKPTMHPMFAVAGAGGGLIGAARCIHLFGMHPEDGDARLLAPVKMNLRRIPPSILYEVDSVSESGGDPDADDSVGLLIRRGTVEIDARKVLAEGKKVVKDRPLTMQEAAAEWLYGLLKHGPQQAAFVQQMGLQEGFTYTTIWRASKDLGIMRERQGFGKGGQWIWKLDPEMIDLIESDDTGDDDE